MRRRRKLVFKCAVLVLTCGVLAAAAELSFRGAGFEYAAPHIFKRHDRLGWTYTPGISGVWTVEGRGDFRINSHGFRGGEWPVAGQNDAESVVMFLGDSMVAALQVDEGETFVSLSETPGVSRHVNCGVSNYGTVQEYLVLEEYAETLRPDVVVHCVFTKNDLVNNVRELFPGVRPFAAADTRGGFEIDFSFNESPAYQALLSPRARFLQWLSSRSRLVQYYRHRQQLGAAGESGAPEEDLEGHLVRGTDARLYVDGHPDYEVAWAALEHFIELTADACRAEGIRYVVVILPNDIQVLPDEALRRRISQKLGDVDLQFPNRKLVDFCVRSDIEVHDMAPVSRVAAERDGHHVIGFENHIPGSGHLNQRGHEVIAAHLKNRVLPGPGEGPGKK